MRVLALPAGGQGTAAVGGIVHAPQPEGVPEAAQLLPCPDVPDAHDAVVAGEQGVTAVGRKGEAVDAEAASRPGVVAVAEHPEGFQVEEPDASLAAAGQRTPAVARDRQAEDAVVQARFAEAEAGTGRLPTGFDVPQPDRVVP